MKKFIFVFLWLLTFSGIAYSAATIIATAVYVAVAVAADVAVKTIIITAITMLASSVIAKSFANQNQPGDLGGASFSPDPGNRTQIPPATNNKLPVVYGSAYVGGTIVDLSITNDNQNLYYVLAISEVTNTNVGQTPDTINFGDIYFGGKKCLFGVLGPKYNGIAVADIVDTNYVAFYGSFNIPNGSQITFANSGSPTVYQVSFSNYDYETAYTYVYFTTNLSGVTVGQTAYFYSFVDERFIVTGLLDESTGLVDTSVYQKIAIYLYRNGSYSPVNTDLTAIQVMENPNLSYKWNITKLMSNCAFAIIRLTYSQSANIRGIQDTRFQVINSRFAPGDCFYDYLINTRYGCNIPLSQINTSSLTELNTYSAQSFSYITSSGGSATQARFTFNGIVDTTRPVMDNLQDMTNCCDCLLKYNEITAQWGVIVQKPTYTVAMDLNDSNIASSISITPLDLAATYNVIECKFPDKTNQDSFNTSTFDLAQIAPSLLFPNEPVNKITLSLPFANNDVQAQYIANRILKSAREDLQLQLDINYVGIQLEAGDIVTVTNANYGWSAKPFRINKIIEQFNDDGSIIAKLTLTEFNASIFDDVSITQYQLAPNTGISAPLFFGSIPAPIIISTGVNANEPFIVLAITSASSGISQYAEVWYSAFQNPTAEQRLFGGTTTVQASGNAYNPNSSMGNVTLLNIPTGNWYFFSRMVNSLGSSNFSSATPLLEWRPTTFQYADRYLAVAYADNINGGGFSLNPTGKTYYGLCNQNNTTPSTNPNLYTWYLANPAFGSDKFLLYINRQSRKFSFGTGQAVFASSTGAYVPADTNIYDQSLWSALPNLTNIIDLDARTGQLIRVGTSSVSSADGLIKVVNNFNGQIVAQLDRFLNFGEGANTKTFTAGQITIDVYGRVVGITTPDDFFYTQATFSATASQTVFSLSHTVGQILVFKNGCLLDESDYTETSSNITLDVPCSLNDRIVILSMKAQSTTEYYEPLNIIVESSTSNSIVYSSSSLPYQSIKSGDLLSFINTGSPTTYTVDTVNYATRTITFTTNISGATNGNNVYRYRNINDFYAPFTRYTTTLTGASTYLPTEWAFRSGFELIFVNGIIYNEIDYDLSSSTLSGFPDVASGNLTIIQFSENSFSVPCSAVTNTLTNTITGQTIYSFAHNIDAFELYANGALLVDTLDYTENSTTYTLVNTPDNDYTILQQQTFARAGAA